MPIYAGPVAPLAQPGATIQPGDYSGSLTTLGATINFGPGTPYRLKAPELIGWDDLGGVPRNGLGQLYPKPLGNGEWKTPHYYPHREVSFVLMTALEWTGGQVQWVAALDALRSVTLSDPLSQSTLAIQIDGRLLYVTGAVISRTNTIDQSYALGYCESRIVFHAFDPNRYGSALTGSTGLASTSGGLAFPASAPFAFTGSVVSGQIVMTNAGNAESPLTVTFTGPVAGMSIFQAETGKTVSFANTALGTVTAGDTLVLTMKPGRPGLALYNNQAQASRAPAILSRDWMYLEPGINTFQFGAASGTGTMSITAAPAWL